MWGVSTNQNLKLNMHINTLSFTVWEEEASIINQTLNAATINTILDDDEENNECD